ncbi:hypothetical protein J5Y09_04320 [Roseomonas sp. PWR1]|uniref:Lipoprotein n=1 Tax=Roseomonas nitratireducens TaxID=2820810 RepID=A0ABS4AP37_9PROT|nr:hypothetical protein [Neoroseomonas nitratireducens]MBP0463126.1 hypothetical protein [Neoroseomonas nitratireducens]
MRLIACAAALTLAGCAIYPDGRIGPLPPAPPAGIYAPAPAPLAYAPPAYGYGDAPGVPIYVVPQAPPPVAVYPSFGIGLGWGWGGGYWGGPYRRHYRHW